MAPRPSCREHTPLLSVEGEVRVATATEPAKLFRDCVTCEKTDGNPIARLVSCGQAIVHPMQVLEKRFNRIYTSCRLNESRVLKPHREADGADGSVQRASIKNWRRPIVSIFFFATFDTRLNVMPPPMQARKGDFKHWQRTGFSKGMELLDTQ